MTAPIRSGSVPTARTLRYTAPRNHVRFHSLVSEYAARTRCRWSTAKARLSLSHQSNPVTTARGIVEFLREFGAHEYADAFVRHVAEAGIARPVIRLVEPAGQDLLSDFARWDAEDNEALVEFLKSEMACPAATDTLMKALSRSAPLTVEFHRAVAAHRESLARTL